MQIRGDHFSKEKLHTYENNMKANVLYVQISNLSCKGKSTLNCKMSICEDVQQSAFTGQRVS